MKNLVIIISLLFSSVCLQAQNPTLKVSNLSFRTGNSEVSFIEFFVTNPDVQAFQPESGSNWNLELAEYSDKWSAYEPQFKSKIESMKMPFLSNLPQKCVAKIIMADKKMQPVVQMPVVVEQKSEPIAVKEEVRIMVPEPVKIAKPIVTPQESWETVTKDLVEVDMALLTSEKSAMANAATVNELESKIKKEKNPKNLKSFKTTLEDKKTELANDKKDIAALRNKKTELVSTVQALIENNDIQLPKDRNVSNNISKPEVVTANIDNKLDIVETKPTQVITKPVVKPIVKEEVKPAKVVEIEPVENTKETMIQPVIEPVKTPTKVVTQTFESVVVERPKTETKVISDVSTSTISSSKVIEVAKKKHVLSDCPDLELDSIWLGGVSKKWITVNMIVRNNSTASMNMYGPTRFDDDNVAVRFYINGTENLTRGAIAGEGEYIMGILDQSSGLLTSDQTIKYTVKFNGEQRTKLTPFIIAELNPFGMNDECNPKNNYKTLKIME